MILVGFNFALKLTFHKWSGAVAMAVVCALVVGLTWPLAIEQSKTQIADWLLDVELMRDISMLLTIEVALQMGFCMTAAHVQNSGKLSKRTLWTYRAMRFFPGLLIFPVLFSLLTLTIFAFPGKSFALVAWTLAVVVALTVVVLKISIAWLFPEKEVRLELLFLSNALLATLGIIATVNGRTAIDTETPVDLTALAAIVGIVVAGGVVGMLMRYIKTKRNRQQF